MVDGFQYGQTTNLDKYLYIVDTGTTLMYLPPREYPGPRETFVAGDCPLTRRANRAGGGNRGLV